MNPKTYRFKGNDTKTRIGLISQEVKKVLPNLVHTQEGKTESVNYLELIPLLIGSIKELQEEIEDLKYMVYYK